MNALGGNNVNSQLPLAGAILCCTAIPPEHRAQLATIGAQMGATIKLDLTSDVTHLIVGSINSAKYRYVAKSRDDVKVLSPEWLEALRSVWMEGDDVDVAMLETQYRLPTFYGLKICLTGFENPEQRRYIQEMVDLNGAEYHGDLTKSVTHLIAAAPTGKKYEHAYQWRMKIVSFEWFEQSLQRTMTLDEDCFHPTMPVEERGKGAWDRRRSTTPTIGKRTRDAENAQLLNISRRKLRRSASSKMGVQSDALWAGITASGLEKPRDEEDDWTEDSLPKQAITRAEARTKLATEVSTRQEDARADEDPASDTLGPPSLLLKSKGGIFQGCIVFTHGFDEHKTTILRDHLDSNGANVIRSSDLERLCSSDLKRGFLVVPHDAKVDFTSLPAGAEIMGRATNWWVERCLHGKCLVDPSADILSRPFDSLSINGFNGLIVNSTGFIGIELLHVTKIITLMGATYDEVLSGKTSVMICNSRSPNPEKIKFATSKHIPGVHATWLWDCIRIGEVQPYTNYLLNSLSQETATAKGKPRSSYAEVPTAPLSEEDSIKLRQKKKQPTRVPTKAGGPQRRTLDLTASLTPGSTTESSTRQNTSTDHLSPDQDEGLDGGYDGAASFPLQDINPSVNSPRRPSTSSAGSVTKPSSTRSSSSAEFLIQPAVAKGKSTVAKEPTSDSVIPPRDSTFQADSELPAPAEGAPKELEKDYSTILSNLLANRKSAPTPADQGESKRRKHRTLGRAISSRSNPSTADDLLSRTSSAHNALDDDGEERENKNAYEYQPSQELGWDSPGAARTREQMIRRLGGKVEGRSVAVEGIGVVKDVMPSGAAGLASGRSTRKKRG